MFLKDGHCAVNLGRCESAQRRNVASGAAAVLALGATQNHAFSFDAVAAAAASFAGAFVNIMRDMNPLLLSAANSLTWRCKWDADDKLTARVRDWETLVVFSLVWTGRVDACSYSHACDRRGRTPFGEQATTAHRTLRNIKRRWDAGDESHARKLVDAVRYAVTSFDTNVRSARARTSPRPGRAAAWRR